MATAKFGSTKAFRRSAAAGALWRGHLLIIRRPTTFCRASITDTSAVKRAREWGNGMHFAISTAWGPTDPTRAVLPFIFAASAVQAGDTVTLMLFHDAVLAAVDGVGVILVLVGPP